MTEIEKMSLRSDKLSLLIGTMIGGISELLNNIQGESLSNEKIYSSLYDLHNMAAMQVHELFYKKIEEEDK